MRNFLRKGLLALTMVVSGALVATQATAQTARPIERIEPRPVERVVQTRLAPVTKDDRVPGILWADAAATLLGLERGIFREEGVNFQFYREDDFLKQIADCMSGQTPYLRGTLGMGLYAAPLFERAGDPLVLVTQLTWSEGGDVAVLRQGVPNIAAMGGNDAILQFGGPHMDFAAIMFANSGVPINTVRFTWVSNLTRPTDPKYNGPINDPVTGFETDTNFELAFMISPDAAVVAGPEGTVAGARSAFSTETANNVIADCYFVRQSYLQAHPEKVLGFARGLYRSEEALRDLIAQRSTRAAEWNNLMKQTSQYCFGDPTLTADVEALVVDDARFVGLAGATTFLTGKTATGASTTATMDRLTQDISTAFKEMGLLPAPIAIRKPTWDIAALSRGLQYASVAPSGRVIDQATAQRAVEQVYQGGGEIEDNEVLPPISITFGARQSTFPVEQYATQFERYRRFAELNGGAILVIEGHADPASYNMKQDPTLREAERRVLTITSGDRANAVRESFLQFCRERNSVIDPERVIVKARGIEAPIVRDVTGSEADRERRALNRRCVLQVIVVEGEID